MPWAVEKKSPPKNTASSLQNHKIQTAAFKSNGATNYTLAREQPRSVHRTPSISINLAAHTAHPLFLSLVGYTALLGVALELAFLLFDPALCELLCLRTAATASFSSAAAYFLSLVPVAAHLRRVLWVSAMSLFARYGCASNQTALRTTPGHANNEQRTPHTLYFYPSSDTPRSSALRWNLRLCCSILPCVVCRVCVRRRLRPSVRLLHTFSR